MTVPDELAARLLPVEDRLPEILESGVREWAAHTGSGFAGLVDVLERPASLPTPEQILALRPSPALEGRTDSSVEKNRSGGFSAEERRGWEQSVERLVRLAKAWAGQWISVASSGGRVGCQAAA